MAEVNQASKRKEILTLISVLGTGVLSAVLLAVGMLYYYNPPGSYLAGNMLVDPSRIATMQYSEATVRGGDNTPFIFAGIEYSYFDLSEKSWKRIPVTIEMYNEFFLVVAKERSLVDVSDEVKGGFFRGHPSSLSLLSRRDNGLKSGKGDFLKIDFSDDGDYYRIQLRAQGKGATDDGWVYFHHAGIGKIVMNLLIPRSGQQSAFVSLGMAPESQF